MSDKDIIIGYREKVIDIHGLQEKLAWNQRHGLPIHKIREEIRLLMADVIEFENVLERIQDRRARVIIRCRYVLGMSVRDIAFNIGLSCKTVSLICRETLQSLS